MAPAYSHVIIVLDALKVDSFSPAVWIPQALFTLQFLLSRLIVSHLHCCNIQPALLVVAALVATIGSSMTNRGEYYFSSNTSAVLVLVLGAS